MDTQLPNEFFDALIEVIKSYLSATHSKKNNVIEFTVPHKLSTMIQLRFENTPKKSDELLALCKTILQKSVATSHPYFFNQLYAGADIYGILGEFLASVLNTSMATYEIAPVFTLMEQEVFWLFASKIGREQWTYQGLMLAGGSLSLLYSILVARFRRFPHVIDEGMYWIPQLAIFTSDQWHYAIAKSAATLWLGKKHVISVPTDETGAMIPEELEYAIQHAIVEGLTPLMVNATAGTTVLGAFDPLEKIADICNEYNLRLHVDASRGGAALFSSTHGDLLKGLVHADSRNFNPHKALRAPQQCSVFMVHNPDILDQANALQSTYYFQTDKAYDTSYDTGDHYIQCARKNDVLKLRLMFQAHGLDGIQKNIDSALSLSQRFAEKLQAHSHFFVYQNPSYLNVCFRRLPAERRDQATRHTMLDHKTELHRLTAGIKALMLKEWTLLINHQPFKDFPNCIRQVFIRPDLTEDDLDTILQRIDKRGEEARAALKSWSATLLQN